MKKPLKPIGMLKILRILSGPEANLPEGITLYPADEKRAGKYPIFQCFDKDGHPCAPEQRVYVALLIGGGKGTVVAWTEGAMEIVPL